MNIFARRQLRPDNIARAVSNDRTAMSTERCEDQLGQFAIFGGRAGRQRSKLGDEFVLDNEYSAAARVAKSPWTNLRGARVVDDDGIPSRFDMPSHCWHRAAGFTGNNDSPDFERSRIDVILAGNLRQAERVAGRA